MMSCMETTGEPAAERAANGGAFRVSVTSEEADVGEQTVFQTHLSCVGGAPLTGAPL